MRHLFREVLQKTLDLHNIFENEADRLKISEALCDFAGSWLTFERHSLHHEWREVRSARGSLRSLFSSGDAAVRKSLMERVVVTPTCDRLRADEVPIAHRLVARLIHLLETKKWKRWHEPREFVAVRTSLFQLKAHLQDLLAQLEAVEFERSGTALLARLVVQ